MKRILSLVLALMLCLSMVSIASAIENPLPKQLLCDEVTDISVMSQMHTLQTESSVPKMKYWQWLKEATNINVVLNSFPTSQYQEKKTLALASGEFPDLISSVNATELNTYAPQGYFLALDEYINETDTPNIWKLFQERPQYKSGWTSLDGHIYAISFVIESVWRDSYINMFINKSWLDKLELAVPETTDEFVEVLKAFRDKDPNGNGKADEVPFAAVWSYAWDWYDMQYLFSAFGMPCKPDTLLYVDDDQKVCYAPTQPQFKECLEWFKMLYDEKLLDNECFTMTNTDLTSRNQGDDPIYGVYFDWYGSSVSGKNMDQYIAMAPLEGGYGKTWVHQAGQASYGGWAINANCKNPELVVKFLDYMLATDVSVQTLQGTFGDVLLWNEELGKYEYPEEDGWEGASSQDEFRVSHVPSELMPYALTEEGIAMFQRTGEQWMKQEVYYPVIKPYLAKNYVPSTLHFTDEQDEERVLLAADINGYANMMIPGFITGQYSIADDYENFVNKLKEMKLDRYLELYQNAYDLWLGK